MILSEVNAFDLILGVEAPVAMYPFLRTIRRRAI